MATRTAERTALIIVDVQYDFCDDGALPVAGGHLVADGVGEWLRAHRDRYTIVVATRDWHPPALAGHFAAAGEQPDFRDTWPPHGVAGSHGAALHSAVPAHLIDVIVSKGQRSAAYSGFEGYANDSRTLAGVLHGAGVTRVDVCGLATSHCVKATALDALARGFAVEVLVDLCAGVTPSLAAEALDELRRAGALMRPTP